MAERWVCLVRGFEFMPAYPSQRGVLSSFFSLRHHIPSDWVLLASQDFIIFRRIPLVGKFDALSLVLRGIVNSIFVLFLALAAIVIWFS